jgi:hypothetical protein
MGRMAHFLASPGLTWATALRLITGGVARRPLSDRALEPELAVFVSRKWL